MENLQGPFRPKFLRSSTTPEVIREAYFSHLRLRRSRLFCSRIHSSIAAGSSFKSSGTISLARMIFFALALSALNKDPSDRGPLLLFFLVMERL